MPVMRNTRKADEVLKNEIAKGYVQWTDNRQEIELDVRPLELAKIAVVVKGEKVRLIHDMRRNGTNSKVTCASAGEGHHRGGHGVVGTEEQP